MSEREVGMDNIIGVDIGKTGHYVVGGSPKSGSSLFQRDDPISSLPWRRVGHRDETPFRAIPQGALPAELSPGRKLEPSAHQAMKHLHLRSRLDRFVAVVTADLLDRSSRCHPLDDEQCRER